MPYSSKKTGNKITVTKKDTGEVVGHTTPENYKGYMAALHMHEPQKMAGGGFVSTDENQALADFLKKDLTPGSSAQQLVQLPQTKEPDTIEPPKTVPEIPEKTDEPVSEDEQKIKDSFPGHQTEDLSNYISGQQAQVSKYGPEQEKAVLDSILKERSSIPLNIGRGLAAFSDTAAPAFGAGGGNLRNIDERRAEMEKARLEQVPALQEMNLKQMGQQMGLEAMKPGSPMAQAKANAYQSVFKQLFPKMDSKTLDALTANPSIAEKIFPEIGPVIEKQIQMELQKENMEINRERLKTETANQKAERTQQALKSLEGMGFTGKILHPDIYKQMESQAGLGTTTYSPDVLSYAQKHNITPEQANQIKIKRTGGK